jgi:hypothetical protein
MKRTGLVFCILTFLIIAACTKSSTKPDPGAGSNFNFKSLTVADSVIKVNEITTIYAIAFGDGLTYKWTASYGNLIGSGPTIQWTVCHQNKFNISCQVTDQYNHSETKTIVVRSQN